MNSLSERHVRAFSTSRMTTCLTSWVCLYDSQHWESIQATVMVFIWELAIATCFVLLTIKQVTPLPIKGGGVHASQGILYFMYYEKQVRIPGLRHPAFHGYNL